LEPVCFKAWRTVSYDTDSTTWSSTSRSASSRNVQRLWPSGGALQVSATSRASCSPSSRRRQEGGGAGGVGYTPTPHPRRDVLHADPGHGGGIDLQRGPDGGVGP